MNFQSFAAEVLASTQIIKTPQAARDLLPQHQQTRSYQAIEKKKPSGKNLAIDLIRYHFGESRGEWEMNYSVQFSFAVNQKDVTDKQMMEFAEEYLISKSDKDDYKYVGIKKADKKRIIFIFEVDEWIKHSFGSFTPKFVPPTALFFKFKKDVPLFIRINSSRDNLSDFIGKKFKEYMKKKQSRLKNKNFAFLKKATSDMFLYSVDFQYKRIKATLKYTVIMAAIAGYYTYKYKKDIGAKDVKIIRSKLSRLGDVKRLDKYLKKL